MDMTYITCLLKDGFGFKESTVLQVRLNYTTKRRKRQKEMLFRSLGDTVKPAIYVSSRVAQAYKRL